MNRFLFSTLGVCALIAATSNIGAAGCDPNSCEEATDSLKKDIREVCNEPGFSNNPFCRCCVAGDLFSIDDSCTCKHLVLDADACSYAKDAAAKVSIRSALVHAESICKNASVVVPYTDAASIPGCPAPTLPNPGTVDAAQVPTASPPLTPPIVDGGDGG